jgi:transcription elongation factor Elf1
MTILTWKHRLRVPRIYKGGWGASQPRRGDRLKAPACRFCESANVIKARLRYNRNKRQRFRCKSCGKRFTVDDGFLHIWYDKRIVSEAVNLHYEGLSCRAVTSHFERHALGCLEIGVKWFLFLFQDLGAVLGVTFLSYIFENNVRMKL